MSRRKPFSDATSRRHERRDRDFDLLHLRVELSFDLELGAVFGRVTQRLAALGPDRTELTLDCAELEVDAVHGAKGEALGFTLQGGRLGIALGAAPAEGQAFEITIAYHGRPRTGMWFVRPDDGYPDKPRQVWTQGEQEDTRYWVPTWDHPNDKATTELLATVPETWVALSNGRLVGTSADPAKKTRTFHWLQEQPHATYLLSLVAGEMDEAEDKSPSGVPLRYLVPKGRGGEIERSFARTPDMMSFFESFFGVPYPWAKYAQAVVYDFTFGGMENTSATTLTDRTLHDERAHLDYQSEGLVAHELAHQWWGDLVTAKSWEHLWLNEGFATYAESLWKEHSLGRDEGDYNRLEKADKYFQEDDEDYRRPIVERVYTDSGDLFDRHAYEKASLVVHMLRAVLGDHGFKKGLAAYLERHREKVAETSDLRMAIEDATGRNLEWFFEQWLLGSGYPEIELDWRHDPATRVLTLRLRQVQDTSDGTPLFRLPLTVRVYGASGGVDHRFQLDGKEALLCLPAAEPPRAVTLDPGNQFLKRLRFERPVEWLAWELEHADAAIDRALAARALGPATTPAAVVVLKRALTTDRFWGVRAQAAKALGRSATFATAFAALGNGLADRDSRVRSATCEALGELRDRAAREPLAGILATDPSYYARAEAAKALGKLRGVEVFEVMRAALDLESHQDIIRQRVFDGLVELEDKRAVPVALEWARYGRPPKAREAALKALGKLGKDDRTVREEVERIATADPYIWAREAAIEALGELKDAASLPVLERAAQVELDSRLRRAARQAAAKVRAGGGDEQLRRDLHSLREEGRELGRRLSAHEARQADER